MRLKTTFPKITLSILLGLFSAFSFISLHAMAAEKATHLKTVAAKAAPAKKVVQPNPEFLSGSKSYTYKVIDDISLRLHVFGTQTVSEQPKSAIIFFFGGGLRSGSVMQFFSQATALSEQGMLAIVADYRVLLRHNTGAVEAVADAQSAIRWLREHASELNLDPNNIVAAGGSSGGYLAAATATVDELDKQSTFSSKPNAIALFNPALAGKYPRTGKSLSPYQSLIDESVPTFIVHGDADNIVPFSSAVAYCDKVISLTGYCELHRYAGAEHGFFNRGRDDGKAYLATLSQLETFLIKFGFMN